MNVAGETDKRSFLPLVHYKVSAQKQYAIDFDLDCARPAVTVEIGPGGEAAFKAQP